MRRLRPQKRYFLLVVLVHAQLRSVMDDAVEIFNRKIKGLHNTAEVKLAQYHLQQVKRAEKLIGQFRDVLGAYQDGDIVSHCRICIDIQNSRDLVIVQRQLFVSAKEETEWQVAGFR